MKKQSISQPFEVKEKSILQKVKDIIDSLPEGEQNLFIDDLIKYYALKRYKSAKQAHDILTKQDDLYKHFVSINPRSEVYIKEFESQNSK